MSVTTNLLWPELPVLEPTIGRPMTDIRGLDKKAGCYAYDPALGATGICRSKITYVDGDNGILLYRGYPIAELVEQCSYLEICWLLLNGELATAAQLEQFTYDIVHHTMVNEQLHAIYRGFRRDSHPMAVMCGVVGALAAFYHDGLDIFDPLHRIIASHRLIAKMPTRGAVDRPGGPRAERLDLGDATRRIHSREPLRLHCRRHCRAVGTVARRCQ